MDQLQSGLPYPSGANWDWRGVNFALFSAHAERVDLCLFDAQGTHELARLGEAKDITWMTPAGLEKTPENWSFPEARYIAFILAAETSAPALFAILNAHFEALEFVLPATSSDLNLGRNGNLS